MTVKITDHSSAQLQSQSIIPKATEIPIEEVIQRIVNLNDGLRRFWAEAAGWAPLEAAQLLEKSRLDRQVSLSNCLRIWIDEPSQEDSDGYLILGWANLGILVEGTMKLFLSVWYKSYKNDEDHVFKRRGKLQDPDKVRLESMRQYFKREIWDDAWDKWVHQIQQRRNAIHAYEDRDIGTYNDLLAGMRKYLEFLRYVNFRLPYPDEMYIPREF